MVGICVDGGGDREPGAIPDETSLREWEGERGKWEHYVLDIAYN
jgi:hypothetical protein